MTPRRKLGRFELSPFDWRGKVEGKRIIWENEGEIMWLEPYGKDSLRFRSTRSLHIDTDLNWTLLPPQEDQAEISVDEECATIKNGKITAKVDGDGGIRYYNEKGDLILSEYWIDKRESTVDLRRAREFTTISSDAFEIELYFKANSKEHFFGMGQDPNDCFDLKGSTIPLEQKNTKCTVPFVYSTMGYGFLWNNPAIGEAQFVNNHTKWYARAAAQIDYIVIAGDTPKDIMYRYTEITGRAPVLPEWAAGFWQCKLRYKTQEELLNVAREYHRRGIPLDVIVADYFHWTQQGEWKFDPKYWPDPKAMVEELNSMGTKLMVSIWPTVDTRSENFVEMREKNYLIRSESGQAVFRITYGSTFFFDPTNPGARDFVWGCAKKNYYDNGIKMFWLDESEPSFQPYHYRNVRLYMGNGLEVSNIFPYYYAKTFYDGLKQQGETEIVNLLRCAWLGSQRNSIVVWSGDIASTFDSLRKQIKAGLNFSFSGVPWWTTDIGGFFNGDPESEDFRELLVRWFQFGVFCPIFRLHGNRLPEELTDRLDPNAWNGSGGPNEAWSYGEKVYRIIKDLIFLRERIKPYIMQQMRTAAETGTPVIRPLLFDFPTDEKTFAIGDEYLFGPDLLVAPVIEAGARSRKVYLPVGAKWTDVNTGKEYEGGVEVECDAPIDVIPLFFRDGARLPIKE